MSRKYTTKKYNGDDRYSWAVFKASDVKGLPSPIELGQALPVVSGLSRDEARYYRERIEEMRA